MKRLLLLFVLLFVSDCSFIKATMFNASASNKESRPELVIESIGISPNSIIADIGSGGGFYTLEFSKKAKKVYAVDVDENLLAFVRKKAEEKKLENIEYILSEENNSHLPEGQIDIIFIRDVYHHLKNPVKYMKNLQTHLKPNGKIVVIDYFESGWNFQSLTGHFTPEAKIRNEMEEAGFALIEKYKFLPKQSFGVYKAVRD